MVDPLDGTTNFVHRFPFSCVCVGLAVDKKAVVGVVHNPILKVRSRASRAMIPQGHIPPRSAGARER